MAWGCAPCRAGFLLSNNHMNTIVTHKFDFSDEEVLAYYISFMRSLSMRLTKDTVHFFCNEHLADFPLYVQALQLFNHKESMVRVAVRTLTLNVYVKRSGATRWRGFCPAWAYACACVLCA